MKVVIGPLNIASQPYYLASGLRKYGVDATSLVYNTNKFGYAADWRIQLPKAPAERVDTYKDALLETLKQDYDIYHFFQRPICLPFPAKDHNKFLGFEIPLLKARGKRVAYRFTGWELIDKDIELANNKYSAFRHGWDGAFNPHLKREYLEFLKCYCDAFMVVDPMMHEHLPEAEIVPRILPVDEFTEVGIEKKEVPLILHAPSNKTYKGSKYILNALEDLKNEGVRFELKLLENVPYKEAIELYKRADIIVDQILIGWYGVLATECMAMGKPVAVYMRDDLVRTPEDVPVQNINIDNVKEKLKELIQDYSLRESLAKRGREYVESVHDEKVVIPRLIEVYKKMQTNGNSVPKHTADIEYFFQQRKELELNAGYKKCEGVNVKGNNQVLKNYTRTLRNRWGVLTNRSKRITNAILNEDDRIEKIKNFIKRKL